MHIEGSHHKQRGKDIFVEFQRRSGDSSAMHKVFDDACNQFGGILFQSVPTMCDDGDIKMKQDRNHNVAGILADSEVYVAKYKQQRAGERSKLVPKSISHIPVKRVEMPSNGRAKKLSADNGAKSVAGSGLNAVRHQSKRTKGSTPPVQFTATI